MQKTYAYVKLCVIAELLTNGHLCDWLGYCHCPYIEGHRVCWYKLPFNVKAYFPFYENLVLRAIGFGRKLCFLFTFK